MADKNTPPISCYWGTPFLDATGSWQCPSQPGQVGGVLPNVRGIDQLKDKQLPVIIYYNGMPPSASGTTATPASSADTIFGLPKNMVYIGGAIGALFLLNSFGGGGKK